ncbi:MAG: formylglycine-generating enzyme family protein, partial [Planctomycetes bacterium]|nr:formylglycine-generating enzyme family protein [Planctomycetota bacterium]
MTVNRQIETQEKRMTLCVSGLFLVLTWMGGAGCQKKNDQPGAMEPVQILKTKTGIEMVCVPAGAFEMGSSTGTADEAPVHRVRVDAFLMDRYEVTQALYSAFPLPDPSHFKNPQHPVDQINWTDALAYCNERSLAEDLTPCYDLETGECHFQANGFRLPTEAEWEYACRAGTQTEFSHGDQTGPLGEDAWYKANAPQSTQPVAQKQPNAWG